MFGVWFPVSCLVYNVSVLCVVCCVLGYALCPGLCEQCLHAFLCVMNGLGSGWSVYFERCV